MKNKKDTLQKITGIVGYLLCLTTIGLNKATATTQTQLTINILSAGGISILLFLTCLIPGKKMKILQLITFASTGVLACIFDEALYITGDLLIISAILLAYLYGLIKKLKRCIILWGAILCFYQLIIRKTMNFPVITLLGLPSMGLLIYFILKIKDTNYKKKNKI